MNWQDQHLEAMRQEAAAEAARHLQAGEAARMAQVAELNRVQGEALETTRQEVRRQASAQAYCNAHGIPISVQGACPMCISETKTQEPLLPAVPSWSEDQAALTGRPELRESPALPESPTQERWRRAEPGDGPRRARDEARAYDAAAGSGIGPGRYSETAEPANRLRPRDQVAADDMRLFREEVSTRQPMRQERHRPLDAEHAKVKPSSNGRQPGHGVGHKRKRVPPEDRRPPKRDPDRAASGHPRGSVEFYCGNCCTLSFTPGYCTACGAMLKALDAAGDRPRQSGEHDHHLLPSQFDRSMFWKDRDINLLPSQFDQSIGFWKDRDINRNDFCVTLPPEYHRQIHALWNDEWAWFIIDHPDATREQIRAQMYAMMDDYELDQFKIHGYRRKE